MSKYLFVIPTLYVGGAERQVSVLSNTLSKLGQDVCVLKYYPMADEYPISEKVRVRSFVKGPEEYRKSGLIKRILFIRKVIKEEKPDFVLPFLYQVALAVDIASVGLKVNVFQSIRNDPTKIPVSDRERKVRDRLVYKSKCSFVQTEPQKQYFDKKAHGRIHVLFNPISDEFFKIQHKPSDKEFMFCAAGRLHIQKNFELLIRSFIRTFDKDQNVTLTIYGEGYLRENLQELIDSAGYSAKIRLPGRTKDIKNAYAGANAFVMSSDFEGFPNVLMEAMASGVPSISTNCPTGPSELIDDGQNGILVPVNDENALSEAMKRLYENKELREKFSEAGREKIREICSAEKTAKKFMAICEAGK